MKSKATNPYSGVSFEYDEHTWGMCARDNGVDILLDSKLIKHIEKQGNSIEEIEGNEEEISLKQSEEDENIIEEIDALLYTLCTKSISVYEYEVFHSWLKSLKERLKNNKI